MNDIYFDNSSTTALTPRVLQRVTETLNIYGNPSSVHSKGIEAERILSEARAAIIKGLGIKNSRSGKIIFTASGTEADNMALLGIAHSKNYRFTPRIIISDSEHPAVLAPAKKLEDEGFDVARLKTVGGIIDFDELEKALTPETILVSIMRVNNETGAVYDLKRAFEIVRQKCPDTVKHCDAVQGFMKINCNPAWLGADVLSLSGHKINAPKGVGALWCAESLITQKRLQPIVFGGGQEDGFRSGTENISGIAGFAEAVQEKIDTVSSDYEKVTVLAGYIKSKLPDGIILNTPQGEYLPHIISIRVPGVKSEVLVRYMSGEGIYISAGSACSAKKLKTSSTLTAFGLTPEEADCTVRVSISAYNNSEEADVFLECLKNAAERLVKNK